MLPKSHFEAERVAEQADEAQSNGELDRAEALYTRAAELEAEALASIPRDKTRTIGIVGVSVASLWYRAARYEAAEDVARSLIENDDLLPSSRAQLDELLLAIPRSQSVASGGAILSFVPGSPRRSPEPFRPRILRALEDLRDSATREKEIEKAYLENRTLVLYVACRKFRIPDQDAEALVQEVFASFAATESKIDDVRAWLVAAACHSSRHYWRQHGRTDVLPDDSAERPAPTGYVDEVAMRMTVRQALDYLDPRCRETLIMHYFEGRSASEVAREFQTTPRYAEKLIHNCLKRVREIYINITTVTS
ncbi:MAG: sigma-70 family RNA polymerase sigma factor [Acidobacteria bacterium]|nr:sigma-70 family RNA polymerase sigma factor [Acidobacteriota bacterium]